MDNFLFRDVQPAGKIERGALQRLDTMLCSSIWYEHPHTEVPRCAFSEYLKLRGWDQAKLLDGRWRTAHANNASKADADIVLDAIAVLQSWLIVGLLEDVFQYRVPEDRYLAPIPQDVAGRVFQRLGFAQWRDDRFGSGTSPMMRALSTEELGSNLLATRLKFNMVSPRTSESLMDSHKVNINVTFEQCAYALKRLNDLSNYDAQTNKTMNVIDLDRAGAMGEHFWLVLMFPPLLLSTVGLHFRSFTPDVTISARGDWKRLLLGQLVSENGWCKFSLSRLDATAGYSVLHWLWASNLNSTSPYSHKGCSNDICRAQIVDDEKEYPTKHIEPCSGDCELYHPPLRIIQDVLHNDNIPVLIAKRVSDPVEERFFFEVSTYDPLQAGPDVFNAFSHVWADGLGSVTEDGIPMCQLRFLAKSSFLVEKESTQTTAFWIDSMFVPREKALRTKAIQNMSRVYKAASSVIVLDSALQNSSMQASPEELLLRIHLSGWMTRVWTYQEAVLAKKLLFRFSDGYCPIDFQETLSAEVESPVHLPLHRSLTRDIYMYLRAELGNLHYTEENLDGTTKTINIGHAALELRWRSTLHRNPHGKNDELIAIGVLLDLDMARLLQKEGEERMQEFLLQVKTLPKNIIFSEVERLHIPAFGWAPNTFLTRDPRRPYTDLKEFGVECTESGLVGKYIVFSCKNPAQVHHSPRRRTTLVERREQDSSQVKTWFDVYEHQDSSFGFTHIVIHPEEVPKSQFGTMLVAAAVTIEMALEKTDSVGSRSLVGSTAFQPENDALRCRFERVVFLVCLRSYDYMPPLTKFDLGTQEIDGHFEARTLLLR